MTQEERVNHHIWWLLQKIKYQYLLMPQSSLVGFGSQNSLIELNTGNVEYTDEMIPSIADRNTLMFKIQHLRGIDILDEPKFVIGRGTIFSIEVLQPEFDKLYEKYKKSCDSQNLEFGNDNSLGILGSGLADKRKFSFAKEKERIRNIISADDHKIASEKWFDIKQILDAIHKIISPFIKSGTQTVSLNPASISNKQTALLPDLLIDMLKAGAIVFKPEPKRPVVAVTSDSARKFLMGENIPIKVRIFEKYKNSVSELCEFIIKDGVKRFPSAYQTGEIAPLSKSKSNFTNDKLSALPSHKIENELSKADKKKLYILERLKEEWDLAPKKDDDPVMIQAGVSMYLRPAREVRISQQKFSAWERECGIPDWYELENILVGFQQDGLIYKFRILSEYE